MCEACEWPQSVSLAEQALALWNERAAGEATGGAVAIVAASAPRFGVTPQAAQAAATLSRLAAWIAKEQHVTSAQKQLIASYAAQASEYHLTGKARAAERVTPAAKAESHQLPPAPRVLFAPMKKDESSPRAQAAMEAAKSQVKAAVVQLSSDHWKSIRSSAGSWEAGYDWAARAFDGIVMLESEDGYLGRGQYTLAVDFLARGKKVGVVRDGKVHRCGVEPFNTNAWAEAYAKATLP